MNFSEELLAYMKLLNCSTKELAQKSNLSYMLINRYLNATRKPKVDSEYFNKLVNGIYQIALNKKKNISKDEIYQKLQKALTSNDFTIDFELFIENFNTLQKELNITTVQISKAIGYDSSFISRMKNKERKPADIKNFIEKLRNYIISICQNKSKKETLSHILNCTTDDLNDNNNFKEIFTKWICSKNIESKDDSILSFLNKIDTFNLNDYIGTDFSKVKVPTSPIIVKSSKTFFGVEGRKKS